MDITTLILDDHAEQRRLFAMIEQIDRDDHESLAAIWGRLGTFLEVHARAEEEVFYPALLAVGAGAGGFATPEDETEDAIADHNAIRDAVAEVARHAVGSGDWFQAVARANEANSDHMAEEEREGLTDVRQQTDPGRRHALAVAFAAFEARHMSGVTAVDRDPETYIAEQERSVGQPDRRHPSAPDASGSLGIGSLKENR